jgi:lysophospholipase L1-like esterase
MKQLFMGPVFVCLVWVACATVVQAQTGPAPITLVQVQALSGAPDLQCGLPPAVKRPPAAPDPDPVEWPDQAAVDQQVKAFLKPEARGTEPGSLEGAAAASLWSRASPSILRVGIWSDSHLAAGFFTQELQRLSRLAPDQVRAQFMPASLGRAGVRLPLRKTCVSPDWQYEPAHAQGDGAAHPGPGLVNMSSRRDGAWLAMDMRNSAGRAEHARVRLLYQQTEHPVLLALRVDEGAEQTIRLQGPQGPAVLELAAQEAMSTLALRVVQGPLRLQGLVWPMAPTVRLQMDVFGYPGATVGGWRHVRPESLMPWWPEPPYDLVVLAFGTNEGNVQPFSAPAYRQLLEASVSQWRAVFPQTACLLIAPGDRGVLLRRSQKQGKSSPRGPAPAAPDLLRFTRVHDEMGRIQKQVAKSHGCHAWSMFEAMGGAGSAYRWARQNPPLMARDLIHFTVPGYQRLAQLMAKDLGWGPELFEVPGGPSAKR